MAQEVELKLRLSRADAARLARHSLLASLKAQRVKLQNTYYDTPDFALKSRGIALRLRRKGWSEWLMTVKGGSSGAGGLAQRSEWEVPTQPGVFDFAIVEDESLREFLRERQPELQPVFSTDFTRTAWTVDMDGAGVEIALDRGTVAAGPAFAEASGPPRPICELELELLSGDSPMPLFALAIELAAECRLHPEMASKAERGYALVEGVSAPPAKAFVSRLTKAMTPVEAFRSVALTCLAQIQRNEAGAIAGGDPEYIHQTRVAIRRLRSAIKLFSPVLPQPFVETYSPRWRDLAASLGSARDWDVFLDETLAPLEEAFPGDPDLAELRTRSEETKVSAQNSAGEALTRVDYSRLLLAFSAALFGLPEQASPKSAKAVMSLRKFAARRLRSRYATIDGLMEAHGKMDAERRHQMRIEFKKLRYALEFFAPLLPRKLLAAYQVHLVAIQNLLGTLNDQVTASRLIKQMQPKGSHDSLTRGWIAGRTQLLSATLSVELKRLRAARRPWK